MLFIANNENGIIASMEESITPEIKYIHVKYIALSPLVVKYEFCPWYTNSTLSCRVSSGCIPRLGPSCACFSRNTTPVEQNININHISRRMLDYWPFDGGPRMCWTDIHACIYVSLQQLYLTIICK